MYTKCACVKGSSSAFFGWVVGSAVVKWVFFACQRARQGVVYIRRERPGVLSEAHSRRLRDYHAQTIWRRYPVQDVPSPPTR